MAIAPHLAVGTTLQGIDDTSFSVFQLQNAPLAAQLVCGNIFLGLQGYVAVRVPLGEFGAGLARGGTIETVLLSAAVSFTANGTWTAGGTISITVALDDSPRFSVDDGLGEAGPFDSRNAWKPSAGYGPSWRRDFSGIFDVRLEDTGGTPFVDLGVATAYQFGIRTIVGHREQIAQIITVPAGPNWSVARVINEMRRFGNPIGTMEVAIQGSTTVDGHIQPDGVDLGVSAPVLNSIITLAPGNGPIPYAFTPDVVLTPGTYWSIIRPAVSYPTSVVNFVVCGQRRVFLGPGGSHRTPLGFRFDLGLYPGHADVFLDTLGKELTPAIVWNPIARVAGQSISTPDLSPLVQEVILTSGHETAHALLFIFKTVGETRTYRFRSNDHGVGPPPGFAARYRRRDTRGGIL